MREIISFTIRSDIKKNIDILRGDIPRSRFIVRLLESYIQNTKKSKRSKGTKPVGGSLPTDSQQVEC
jgi:hypothetical protein